MDIWKFTRDKEIYFLKGDENSIMLVRQSQVSYFHYFIDFLKNVIVYYYSSYSLSLHCLGRTGVPCPPLCVSFGVCSLLFYGCAVLWGAWIVIFCLVDIVLNTVFWVRRFSNKTAKPYYNIYLQCHLCFKVHFF